MVKVVIGLVTAALLFTIPGCSDGASTATTLNVAKPTASAGTDQNSIAGRPVTLNGSQSASADGSQINYQWSVISKPAGSAAILTYPTAVRPTFIPDLAGQYSLKLTVTDAKSNTSEATVIVAAVPNSVPVANTGSPQKVITGALVTLDAGGSSDADGDPLTYSWTFTSIPNGSSATLSSANVAKPTFTPDVAGDYSLALVVNDGYVSSAAALNVTVIPPPTDIVVIGNSIAVHGPAPAIGWNGAWGMSASSADKDFAHGVARSMILPLTVVASRGLELNPAASDAEILKAAAPVKATSLAVIELGDNIQLSTLSASTVQYSKLLDAVKHASIVICTSTWWRDETKDAMIRSACAVHGGRYVYIGDIYPDPANADKHDVPFSDDGVNIHPHDWGMAKIAERIVTAVYSWKSN